MDKSFCHSEVNVDYNSILNFPVDDSRKVCRQREVIERKESDNIFKLVTRKSSQLMNREFVGTINHTHSICYSPMPSQLKHFSTPQRKRSGVSKGIDSTKLFNSRLLFDTSFYNKTTAGCAEKTPVKQRSVSIEIEGNNKVLSSPFLDETHKSNTTFLIKDSIGPRNDGLIVKRSLRLGRFNRFDFQKKKRCKRMGLKIEQNELVKNVKKVSKKVQKRKRTSCKCFNSACIKRYCECFRSGNTCGKSCKCRDCKNDKPNLTRKTQKRDVTEARDGTLKILPKTVTPINNTCSCKKSKCKKDYCPCFMGGDSCNKYCNCEQCENTI